MSRLLRAEFTRLFQSMIYRLGLLFSMGFAGLLVIIRWRDYRQNMELFKSAADAWGDIIFGGGFYFIFVTAIVISIFVGTEYSDGTIRNKVMVGHTRGNIVLSKLIVCAFADLFMLLLYMAAVVGLGYLLFGSIYIPMKEVLLLIGISCFAILALTAIYLTFAILIDSKAIAAVVCLVAAIFLSLSSVFIVSKLSEPEYWEAYVVKDESGEVLERPAERNPNYLSGPKREAYEFTLDFLPSGQLFQVMTGTPGKWRIMFAYDCGIIIVMTGIGMALFKRKNLR